MCENTRALLSEKPGQYIKLARHEVVANQADRASVFVDVDFMNIGFAGIVFLGFNCMVLR